MQNNFFNIIRNKKSIILIFVFCILYFVFSISCSNSTSPSTITLSGTVTLEDTTDYSGVKVKVYEPIEIDSVLLAWNKEYPNVGVQVSQQTEFNPFVETPVAETVTDKDGNWEVKGLPEGEYHVVFDAGEKGFAVLYNQTSGSIQRSLKKTIVLEGQYSVPVDIPPNRVCLVKGLVTFNPEANLSVGEGTVFIFKSDAKIEFYNEESAIVGNKTFPIIFFLQSENNNGSIEVINGKRIELKYTYLLDISKSIFLKNVKFGDISFSYFRGGENCINLFNCDSINLQNNVILNGNYGIISNSSKWLISKNLIIKNLQDGLQSNSEQGNLLKNNVIAFNGNFGININQEGGFGYDENIIQILKNDFISNNIHVFCGINVNIVCNSNNFLKFSSYVVKASFISNALMLNFENNYWNTVNYSLIDTFIYDVNDSNNSVYSGYVIKYKPILLSYHEWK